MEPGRLVAESLVMVRAETLPSGAALKHSSVVDQLLVILFLDVAGMSVCPFAAWSVLCDLDCLPRSLSIFSGMQFFLIPSPPPSLSLVPSFAFSPAYAYAVKLLHIHIHIYIYICIYFGYLPTYLPTYIRT